MLGETIQGYTDGMHSDGWVTGCGLFVAAPSVWYRVTGTGHEFTASTCGNDITDYPTRVLVFCGSCREPVCLGFAYDSSDADCSLHDGIGEAKLTWCAQDGATYFILVSGWYGYTGTFGLTVASGVSCTEWNPDCASPLGACCDTGVCVGNTHPDDCAGGWYEDLDCNIDVCPVGACCLGDVCVGTMFEGDCPYRWYNGEDCGWLACPTLAYCTPCWSQTGTPRDIITNVTFAAINNTSAEEGLPCQYDDFTHLSTEVATGAAYTLSVSVDPCFAQPAQCDGVQHVRAWIDWDQSGRFDLHEQYDLGLVADAPGMVTADIVVPVWAELGSTRMRVAEAFDGDPLPCAQAEWGSSEDYSVVVTRGPARLVGAVPASGQTLWRANNNVITLTFGSHISEPAPGQITIRELLSDGGYGPDLSAHFAYSVDALDLLIRQIDPVLNHGSWYEVRGTRAGPVAEDVVLHHLCLIGDANNDGLVLPNDLSAIQAAIPNLVASDGAREDIDGDGQILPSDLSVANTQVPTFAVPMPSGH